MNEEEKNNAQESTSRFSQWVQGVYDRYPKIFQYRKPLVVGAVLLLLGLVIAIILLWPHQPTAPSTPKQTNTNESAALVSTKQLRAIDGVLVDPKAVNPVLRCVMIDNAGFEDARPQSGLQSASVVYEIIVEGGITRFMAVFTGDENQSMIGPVRSARDTYLQFVSEYNCMYSHAGGSFTAMQAIWDFDLRDLDGLREEFFWREDSKIATHNLFTSTEKLSAAIATHSWKNEKTNTFTPWKFVRNSASELSKADAALYEPDNAITPDQTVSSVSIGYDDGYQAEYTYDADLKKFKRKTGGSEHIDAATDKQITVDTVVIEYVAEGDYVDGEHVNWPVTGEGQVDILYNGKRYRGVWKKDQRTDRTRFFTEDGQELPLASGNIWVSIVPPSVSVSFQ